MLGVTAKPVFVLFNLLIFEPGTNLPGLSSFDPGLGYPSVLIVGDPMAPVGPGAITDICTPFSAAVTTFGASGDNPDTVTNEGGAVVRTNPATPGSYTFTLYARSLPDADGDGIENTLDTCPFEANQGDPRVWGSGDSDGDGLDDACDQAPAVRNADYDGAGGSGNGPNYVSGPIRVVGCDPFGLDRDGDGWGCE